MKSNADEPEIQSAADVPIVLVDDHDIWRDGVRSMLAETEFKVVGEAASGEEAPDVVAQCSPRIVVLDVRMAGGDGFEALRAIKSRFPSVMVIMLTTYSSPTFMARAVADGASGYLLKGMKRAELVDALRAVISGETLLTREDLAHSLRCVNDVSQESTDLAIPLTPREVEVLGLVANGLSNRDVSAALFVSVGTAKTHVENIIRKLGVSDRVQAAVWAARNGLV